MVIRSVDPTTGEVLQELAPASTQAIAGAITHAHAAGQDWARVPLSRRCELLRGAAAALRARRDELARLMAREMGKPVTQGRAELEKCALACDYYADQAPLLLEPQEVVTEARRSVVAFRPRGVVLGVMPWNFPFWQVFRFAIPALVGGNTCLLKHASNVPQCALAIQDLFREALFPAGVFQTLLIGADQVDQVIDHPLVRGVSLTGSNRAGQAVASRAGAALKPTVLELGGSDPYVILEDADLEQAAEACVASRLINAGQSCIAAKRFVVVEAVREPFQRMVVERMRAARMGDPRDEATELGPLARLDLRERLTRQVRDSVAAGARCVLGGDPSGLRGAFFPPTVLTRVPPAAPAWREELFGPVAALIAVPDEAEAIRAANDTEYGLGAAVFTRDLERGWRIARDELEAGSCFVNAYVRSDPRLPFGGTKASGYGRELGAFGIYEHLNVKTIWEA